MTIKLYQCLCENNRMNKESYLQNEITLECVARIPFNKTNPVIIIENNANLFDLMFDDNKEIVFGDNQEIGIEKEIDIVNYCYIVEWERYYFIDNITYNSNKIISFNCSLDVLMSFKNKEWSKKPLYITRRTFGDNFISDNMQQFKYKKHLENSNGETIKYTTTYGYSNFNICNGSYSTYKDTYCIVVAVSDPVTMKSSEIGGYAFNPSERASGSTSLKKATSNLSFSNRSVYYHVITPRMLLDLCSDVVLNSEYLGSILSITALPYAIDTRESYLSPHITFVPGGDLDFSTHGYNADCVKFAKYGNNDRFMYCKIEIPGGQSFKDYEPYTTCQMYIPFAETIDLNLQSVRGCQLALYYYVDFDTSNSFYELYNMTMGRVEHTGVCQLGSKVNLTSSNASELRKIAENNSLSFLFGALSSGLSALTGNPVAMVGATKGVISGMSQMITRENSMIGKANASATNGNTGALLPVEVRLLWSISEPTMNATDFQYFKNNIGLPFNKYEFIYNILDGEHVIIGDTSDVTMSSDMTSNELNLLRQALANGFYK